MIALFDIGNTHTHIGLARGSNIGPRLDVATAGWVTGAAQRAVARFLKNRPLKGAVLCSVVPKVTPAAVSFLQDEQRLCCLQLTHETVRGVGIHYPSPQTIGPDRLANAVAVRARFGAPAVVVDFGTAVTFDVVDRKGDYVGGIIAPGVSVMTDYLHEKTALLPRIRMRDTKAVVGKNTEEAMLIGAVHGYRGLIRQLVAELKGALRCRRLPVVATGGYGKLIAGKLPEISAVEPLLTLEGLRLVWVAHEKEWHASGGERPCFLRDQDF